VYRCHGGVAQQVSCFCVPAAAALNVQALRRRKAAAAFNIQAQRKG
jgi:hypothetical protein